MQKLDRRPPVASKTARPDPQKALRVALGAYDPLALAQARGLFDSLKLLGYLDKSTTLEDWLCDFIHEMTLAVHGAVFGGEISSRTVQGEPDLMVAGGRARTFHLS